MHKDSISLNKFPSHFDLKSCRARLFKDVDTESAEEPEVPAYKDESEDIDT